MGCRHELGVLADAVHLERVVLLFDDSTHRTAGEAEVGHAPAGRFVWLDAGRLGHRQVRAATQALLGG